MIAESKVVDGKSWFLVDGQWTQDASEEQKLSYYRSHREVLWLDEPDVLPIERLLKRRGDRYLVQFLADDEPHAWVHKRDISRDALDDFHGRKPYYLRYDLADASREYADVHKPEKTMVNALFAEAARNVEGRIVYLEASLMQTTTALLAHPQTKIPVNFNHDLYLHMLDRHLPNVSPKYGTLNEYLANTTSGIGALFADYCCTFQGTPRCRPQDDLRVAFERRLLERGGCLALTFCLRDNRRLFRGHQQQKAAIFKFMETIANANAYSLTLTATKHYQRSIFFLLYGVN